MRGRNVDTSPPPRGGAPGRRLLTGWGRTAASSATVVRPESEAEVADLLAGAGTGGPGAGALGPGLLARGMGRAYGDAAQCAGGTVIDTSGLDGVVDDDLDAGVLRCGAGVSLDRLMREYVPKGWFVPVTPGTRYVSVGGAVAADIHGKNHHRDGSFCEHVLEMTLHTPSGRRVVAPSGDDADLFWATAGGMGLTGVVTEATVQMVRCPSAYVMVDTERAGDLDACMARMAETDDRYRYTVAWIDCLARGSHLGRSVITSGNLAELDDLPVKLRPRATHFAPRQLLRAPMPAPSGLLNPMTVAAFNEMWFRKAPAHRVDEAQHIATFFHPLDGVGDWNLLYGRRGFLQYQFVVPDDAADTMREVIERLSAARVASFLAVLKRFGPANPGPLSFPMQGWQLALDMPVGPPQLGSLLDGIDELVADAGGRVYFAKDSRLRPDLLAAMYPALDRWREVRRSVDPDGLLASDLGRRLGLVEGPSAAASGSAGGAAPQATKRVRARRTPATTGTTGTPATTGTAGAASAASAASAAKTAPRP
ncbi:MAG: FAD-binding protein [Acidimicrobiales bacterium]